MVVWRNLIILFLCSVLLWSARADEVEIGNELAEHIKFEMKFHDLILKMSNEIDRDFANIPIDELEKRNMDDYLRTKMSGFIDLYQTNSKLPKDKFEMMKHILNKEVKWSEVWTMFKKLNIGIEAFFKRNGFGVSLAILLGYVSDWVVLLIAGQLGLKTLMVVSPFTPYGMFYALAPKFFHHVRLRNRLITVLGGKQQYNAYMEQMRLTAKELKLGNPYRMLFPSVNYLFPVNTTDDFVEAIVIPKSAPMAGLAQKLGIDIKTLNYNTLLVFMTTNNVKNDYIDWVKSNPKMNRWQKVGAIVDSIIHTEDEATVLAFKNRFHDSFLKIKNNPHWKGLKTWLIEASKMKNIAELRTHVTQVPEWVEAREIMTFWEEILLPELSRDRSITYLQYRKLVTQTELLKASAISSKEKWTPDFQQKFLNIIGKSLGEPEFKSCQNSTQTVLYYMVKQALK